MIKSATLDRKRKIAVVKPGSIFVQSNEEQNPFAKDYHEYVILEVKNGYVLYQDTKSLIIYTTDINTFIYLYRLQQGVKS